MAVRFLWDGKKAAANLHKHKVSFDDVRQAWWDRASIVRIDDREDYGEERFVRISRVQGRLLFVCYTEIVDPDDPENELIRIISARKATRREREEYEN